MNKNFRKKVVAAMDLLARQINNDMVFDRWLMCGVPDGELKTCEYQEVSEDLIDDKTYAELMYEFLEVMSRAKKDGLYSDGIKSKNYS